jgi:AcrR family transcriptional regulator
MAATRTSRRGEATRERIVKAAVDTFAEKGFQAASTRDIAERAGTDQGLLTYHFPSKDALWRAAADFLFGILMKRLDERLTAVQHEEPRERAREAIREYVRVIASHPEFFRFLVDVGNQSSPRMRWLVDTHVKPRFAFMKRQGVVHVTGMDESLAPHAFYTLAGASALIFAVAPACRRTTGLDPRRRDAVETHADYVARLMVP